MVEAVHPAFGRGDWPPMLRLSDVTRGMGPFRIQAVGYSDDGSCWPVSPCEGEGMRYRITTRQGHAMVTHPRCARSVRLLHGDMSERKVTA